MNPAPRNLTPFRPFPRAALDGSICDRFEQQVQSHGHRVAVKSRRGMLTYAALNDAANRLACAILDRRGCREEPVALAFPQGTGEIVAILGVLKAGRMYVPLDPSYPPARLAQMLEDSTAPLIVTNTDGLARVRRAAAAGCEPVDLDALDPGLLPENPGLRLSPDALASIIYTSGSGGQPKGVLQTHRNVLHKVMGYTNDFRIGPEDRLSLLHSCSYGVSVRTIFGALLNGAAVYPFDVRAEGPDALATWLGREGITIYYSVPSLFRGLAAALSPGAELPALRYVHVAGEALTTADVQMYRTRFLSPCRMVNLLGSTETGAIRRYDVDPASSLTENVVPVGYPVEDKEVLVLDGTGAAAGANEIGEIAVRSRYLSPGYWRRPDLTRAVFLPDPEGGADERIYLTGDLGRLRPDGCLEHLGRKDLQVKIRGYRIEVAEIEAALQELGVQEAVVVGRDDGSGGQRLVAYLAGGEHAAPTISTIRRHLEARFPDHMVPSALVVLEALPLTPNGKIDRQALPSPPRARPEIDTPFVLPRTPVEEGLAEIWAELLQLDRVGVHDRFLELGGHSLLATQVVARVVERFAVDVSVRTLFETPTVAEMAVVVVQGLVRVTGTDEVARLWSELDGVPEAADEGSRRDDGEGR